MEETLYYNALYDCYQSLLTEKQKSYFEGYYFYNLSYGEIGENEGVSRNAVYKQVKDTCKKLEEYEEKLHLYEINQNFMELFNEIDLKKCNPKVRSILEKMSKSWNN